MASPEVQALLGDRATFEQLVQQLMSPTNEQRGRAEDLFNQCKLHADPCVGQLLVTLRQSQDIGARSLCAVLLRKVLTKDEPSLWPQLTDPVKGVVKSELLACIKEESNRQILRKVCDTISELAAGIVEGQGWPDLFPFMLQCVQSGDPRLTESALLIFAELAHYLTDVMQQYIDPLQSVFATCLAAPSLDVRLAAMRAVTGFISELESPSDRDKFQAHVPAMLQAMAQALNSGEEAAAQDAVELFIEVAESHPRFLRRQLGEVLNAMLTVAEADSLESSTRQLAAEFLVTLCEARDKAPGMMRKLPQCVGRLFECLVKFLLDIEDDARWHEADSDAYEAEGEGELYEVGQECLDRIALALGGNTVVTLARQAFPPLMADADWRKRHAALICLAQIAEGCVKVMVKDLDSLVTMGLLGLRDPHAKVRWAACQALGQMCTDLGPDIQKKHHATILPALVQAMGGDAEPRVQAHASAAIVNFSENCDQSVVAPYLDNLIGVLVTLLSTGKKMVQEGALTALASVADCSQKHFVKYYDSVMPMLTNILVNATDKPHRLLRAKALECISLVGMAVGRDRFRSDAHEVMKFIQMLQAQGIDADDPTSGYLLQAGARLCKCLGEEFLPYLEVVMPPLLASAQLKPDVQICDADSEAEGEDEDDEVETIYLGDRKISIRTSSLEEKATACNMICCYVDELKDGFYPFVEQVTQIMVPLLKFYFHEDVRQAAVQCMPELLRSALLAVEKRAGQQGAPTMAFVKTMLDFIWTPLLESMQKECDTEILSSMLEAVDEIVDLVAEHGLLAPEQLAVLFEVFQSILGTSEQRRQERLKRRQQEDFDEEEAEALAEEMELEDDLLDSLGSCVTVILRNFGDSAMGYMEALLGPVGNLLSKQRSAEERRVAVCIMDDILEHCPQGSAKYFDVILRVLLEAAVEREPSLRQCAVYGLGVAAQHRAELFRPRVGDALPLLVAIVQAQDSRSEDNEMATENAISALGKLLEFHAEALPDGGAVGGVWVNSLPLRSDLMEAKVVHEQLLRFLDKSDARVLGENNSRLQKVVQVLVEVLSRGDELVEPEAAGRMVGLLHQMQAALPPEVFQSLCSALPPAGQANLQAVLQGGGQAATH